VVTEYLYPSNNEKAADIEKLTKPQVLLGAAFKSVDFLNDNFWVRERADQENDMVIKSMKKYEENATNKRKNRDDDSNNGARRSKRQRCDSLSSQSSSQASSSGSCFMDMGEDSKDSAKDEEEVYFRYMGSREMYLGMTYVISHKCSVNLNQISMTVNEFCTFYEENEQFLTDIARVSLMELVIQSLTNSSICDPHTAKRLEQMHEDIKQSMREKAANDDDDDESSSRSKKSKPIAMLTSVDVFTKTTMLTLNNLKEILNGQFIIAGSLPPKCTMFLHIGDTLQVIECNRNCIKIRTKGISALMFKLQYKMSRKDLLKFVCVKHDVTETTTHTSSQRRKQPNYASLTMDELSDLRELEHMRETGCDQEEGESKDGKEKAETTTDFFIMNFFPIKPMTIKTIDSSQSASFDFDHVIYIGPRINAGDLLVSATRTRNAKKLRVYVVNAQENKNNRKYGSSSNGTLFHIEPFDNRTQRVLDIKNRIQKVHGNL
jgi:hypothetical protein